MFSIIKLSSEVFLNCSRIRFSVSGDSFVLPFGSSSSLLLNNSSMIVKFDISFYLIYIPNFFKSLAIVYLLNNNEQLSVKNSITPLLSIKSPYSPLFFLLVDELKHLSYISFTSIFWSVFCSLWVFFYNSDLWRSTSLWI